MRTANKKVATLFIICVGLNGLVWLFVSLFSLSTSIQDFSMGFLFSITILYVISLFMPIGKKQESDVVE